MPWTAELGLLGNEPFDDGSVFSDGTGFAVDAGVPWTQEPAPVEATPVPPLPATEDSDAAG